MKEKDFYPHFTKKIKEIANSLNESKKEIEFFEKIYEAVKSQNKERNENNDNSN